jgi:hypothetical protein
MQLLLLLLLVARMVMQQQQGPQMMQALQQYMAMSLCVRRTCWQTPGLWALLKVSGVWG